MKKHHRLFLLCTGVFILCARCTRADLQQDDVAISIQQLTNQWLNSRIKEGETVRNERIELIRQNLLPSRASTEILDDGEKLIIVPINAGFKMNHNRDKNADHYLLLFENKNKEVYKGNIVQFIPSNAQQRALPENTLSRLWNCEDVGANGSFTVLTIFDKHLYATTFQNGNKTTYSMVEAGKNEGDIAVVNVPGQLRCIEYYMVTTYYYSDGTTQVFRDYIGTTCYRWCIPGEACAVKEDDGLGGGGNPDEDIEAVSTVEWDVYSNGLFSKIVSSERLRGKKKASLPYGGYFTNITHLGTTKSGSVATWEKTFQQGKYENHTASSQVIGRYTLTSNPTVTLNANKTKNFTVANDL